VLDNLLNNSLFEDPWKSAEAFHFYILCQKQFYDGQIEAATITALHLRNYETIIDPSVIYSLLALVSLHSGYFATCSKAILKLKSLNDKNFAYYEDLAFDIFKK
jgi:WD repeat-containing protein 35